MSVTLTVVRGPHAGRTFTFDGHETFLVGRSSSTHFPLSDDPYLSRVHFLIEVNPPRCRIADLNSHNGIRVNRKPVKGAELADGDEIEAGRSAFKLVVTAADPAGDSGAVVPVPEGRDEDDDHPENELDRIMDEIEDRYDRGEAPNIGEYVAKYPRYAAALRVAFLAHAPTAGPDPDPPSTPAGPRRMPIIPGYTLLGELGRGGMGMVYHARQEADGSEVAVKTITAGAAAGAVATGRFLREAKVLQQLRHPNVVAGLDAGTVKGVPFIVMEYVPGTNTGRLLKDRGPLPVRLAVDLTAQLCDALGYAHGQGIVHRDVKPSNMLLRPDAASPGADGSWAGVVRTASNFVLKLADFGLARAFQDSSFGGLTVTGTGAGTPPFMPPEQVRDFRTARPHSDQYAAGATLYYLLTGRFPHEGGTTGEILRHILEEPPTPLATHRGDVPAAVTAAVHRALAPKPPDRFPDVAAFAAALRAAVG